MGDGSMSLLNAEDSESSPPAMSFPLDGSMSLLNAEDSESSSSGLQGGKGAVKGKGTLKGKGKCTGKGKGATKAKGNRPGTAVDPTSSLRIPILMSRRRDTIFE